MDGVLEPRNRRVLWLTMFAGLTDFFSTMSWASSCGTEAQRRKYLCIRLCDTYPGKRWHCTKAIEQRATAPKVQTLVRSSDTEVRAMNVKLSSNFMSQHVCES